MDLIIKDTNFTTVAVVDDAESVIWRKCYNTVGDFEIYISSASKNYAFLKEDYYVLRADDDSVGIIEHIYLHDDSETGDYCTISGRFAESILDRRIVWEQTTYTNVTVENAIRQFIQSNIINAAEKRRISNFILGPAKNYTDRLDSIQRTGTSLLELTEELCQAWGYGFRVTLNSANQFVFEVYKGIDRSYAQNTNPYVVFADEFDNLVSNSYTYTSEDWKNVALVAGEGEGKDRRTLAVFENNAETSGLGRYELFVDARDISSNEGEINNTQYNNLLKSRGQENLVKITRLFDVDLQLGKTYIYKKDFTIGDIVTGKNTKWGITANMRIAAMTECEDENGSSLVPTLVI